MKLRKSQEQDVEVNLTSLIDVVFLLLIFFMISTLENIKKKLSPKRF